MDTLNIPREIYAGDRLQWTTSLADYPAPSYTARLEVVGSGRLTLVGAADGNDHQFIISSTQSAALLPGQFGWQLTATATNGDRTTVALGHLDVLANLATTNTLDPRSTEEIQLQAVNNAITALLTGGAVQSYSIRGRSLSRYSLDELRSLRAELSAVVSRQNGGGNGRGEWLLVNWGYRG